MVQAPFSLERNRAEMEQICDVRRRKGKAISSNAWELISNAETGPAKEKHRIEKARTRKKMPGKA